MTLLEAACTAINNGPRVVTDSQGQPFFAYVGEYAGKTAHADAAIVDLAKDKVHFMLAELHCLMENA